MTVHRTVDHAEAMTLESSRPTVVIVIFKPNKRGSKRKTCDTISTIRYLDELEAGLIETLSVDLDDLRQGGEEKDRL